MKYLIFGSTGFIGKNLVRYLEDKGEEVLATSRSGNDNTLAIDITKSQDFSKINFSPDIIINCASQVPESNQSSFDPIFLERLFMTNVLGALNITNWAAHNNIPKIFNLSTLVVNKKPWPDSLDENYCSIPEGSHVGYAISKLSQEQIMSNCLNNHDDINLTHFRLSAVYGNGMQPEGIIFKLLEDLSMNKDIHLTDAKINTIDFINVQDVCRSIHMISKKNIRYKVVNLASGKPISVYDLAMLIKDILQSKSVIYNKERTNIPSLANINVNRLSNALNDNLTEFIPLQHGMMSLISNTIRK